jgi:DNA adenine methylase
MGGKARQCKYIAEEVLSRAGSRTTYLEPFVGWGYTFAAISPAFDTVYASDNHPDLMMMWQAVKDGWVPPDHISRELYYELKLSTVSSPLRGFACFGCAFGGKWRNGYARIGPNEDGCGATAHRSVMKKADAFKRAELWCGDYRKWRVTADTVVYCDPPYAGMTSYYTGAFDPDAFWAQCAEWVAAGALVFISEYSAPFGIEQIWERQAFKSLSYKPRPDGVRHTTERLFMMGEVR